MLETFYNNLGFMGALITAFLIFLFIIFWVAGIAGMMQIEESRIKKSIRTTIAILLPIYPFFWMIWEMVVQKIDISGH